MSCRSVTRLEEYISRLLDSPCVSHPLIKCGGVSRAPWKTRIIREIIAMSVDRHE
jgi:hypothetical protein